MKQEQENTEETEKAGVVATGTEARVCADIAARQQLGIGKYGTTVAGNPLPLREWLRHAYEETLDKAVYLRRAIEEMEAMAERVYWRCPQHGEVSHDRMQSRGNGTWTCPWCGAELEECQEGQPP